MSVTAVATITRRQLVQVSDLDPEWELVFQGAAVGDGTGGDKRVTCTIPTDLGCMFVGASCLMNASSTSPAFYQIAVGGITQFFRGAAPNAIDVNNVPDFRDPPRVLLLDHPIVLSIFSDNVNTETMSGRAIAFGWDLVAARNIPQKFFWPGLLT